MAESGGGTLRDRRLYLSDVSEDERAFVALSLTLMNGNVPQPARSARGLHRPATDRVRRWRVLPHKVALWVAVHQLTQRWPAAGMFEAKVHDLCALLRLELAAIGRDHVCTGCSMYTGRSSGSSREECSHTPPHGRRTHVPPSLVREHTQDVT